MTKRLGKRKNRVVSMQDGSVFSQDDSHLSSSLIGCRQALRDRCSLTDDLMLRFAYKNVKRFLQFFFTFFCVAILHGRHPISFLSSSKNELQKMISQEPAYFIFILSSNYINFE